MKLPSQVLFVAGILLLALFSLDFAFLFYPVFTFAIKQLSDYIISTSD